MDADEKRAGVPDLDRAWELAERAYSDGTIKVVGWADDQVMHDLGASGLTFSAFAKVQRSHEDEVLIIALRVPHPDEWTLDEVLHGCQHRHGVRTLDLGGTDYTTCVSCGLVDPVASGRVTEGKGTP